MTHNFVISRIRLATTGLLCVAALAVCGCKQTGFLAKREAEKCCPTDIRKTVPWCAGEDALFHCPCEPSAAFYGYKPTCWRTWPASGDAWRDLHCGNEHHGAVIKELTNQNSELIVLPTVEPLPAAKQKTDSEEPNQNSGSAPLQESEPKPEASIQLEPAPAPPAQPQAPEVERPNEDLPPLFLGPVPLPPVYEE